MATLLLLHADEWLNGTYLLQRTLSPVGTSATSHDVCFVVALGGEANIVAQVPLGMQGSRYRFLPELSIDGYPRRRRAVSIPSITRSWILSRSSKAIFRSAS
jgi:hypothetical protein